MSAPLKSLVSFLDSFDINDIEVKSPEQDMISLENGAANSIRLMPCLQVHRFCATNGLCYSMIVGHTHVQPHLLILNCSDSIPHKAFEVGLQLPPHLKIYICCC